MKNDNYQSFWCLGKGLYGIRQSGKYILHNSNKRLSNSGS